MDTLKGELERSQNKASKFNSNVVIVEVDDNESLKDANDILKRDQLLEKNLQIEKLSDDIEALRINNEFLKFKLDDMCSLDVSDMDSVNNRNKSSKTFETKSINNSVSEDVFD